MTHDPFWVRLVGDDRLLDIAEQFIGPPSSSVGFLTIWGLTEAGAGAADSFGLTTVGSDFAAAEADESSVGFVI